VLKLSALKRLRGVGRAFGYGPNALGSEVEIGEENILWGKPFSAGRELFEVLSLNRKALPEPSWPTAA
jgi:hypothetical protein